MDHITYSSSSSSSSASSSSSSNNRPSKTRKSSRPSYTDSLHSIRKPTQKPITKQYIAPLPPTPHKVYNVTPSGFKQAVRMLTSTPKYQSPPLHRLKAIAPPPLTLSTIPKPSTCPKPPSTHDFSTLLNETMDTNKFIPKSPVMDYFESLSPLGSTLSPAPQGCDQYRFAPMSPFGLNLSPSSLSWCSSVLLSPTNLSGFNQSPIL